MSNLFKKATLDVKQISDQIQLLEKLKKVYRTINIEHGNNK